MASGSLLDYNEAAQFIQSKYHVTLHPKWFEAFQNYFKQEYNNPSYSSSNHTSNNVSNHTLASNASPNSFQAQLEREFLHSNFYQSVSSHLQSLRCTSFDGKSETTVSIASQRDLEQLDRVTILNMMTFQVNDVQDISLPFSDLTIDEEDDEESDANPNALNESVNDSSTPFNDSSMQNDLNDSKNDINAMNTISRFRSYFGTKNSNEDTENRSNARRTLKFALTDGRYQLFALEVESLGPFFRSVPPPGTKFTVQNVPVRRGTLLLSPKCMVRVWGGFNEQLIALSQENRKSIKKAQV